MRLVPPERRRARLGISRPRDPRLPASVGYRERFRHELIDLRECPVLEPALFVLIGRLRQSAHEVVQAGGSAEATLTRTDSWIDLLIEAAERPDLGVCEVLARFAEDCDLARIVWRSGPDEIVVVERRVVRVLLSGVAVPFPPGAFLQASPSAEMILVEEVLSGVGPGRPALDLFAGLGTFTFAWRVVVWSMLSRATCAPLLRSPAPRQTSRRLPSSAATWPATRLRRAGSPAMRPRSSIRRAPAPARRRQRSPSRR
jgi:23S rRNA (uracil1939-C5)-methyltransferase